MNQNDIKCKTTEHTITKALHILLENVPRKVGCRK